MWHQACRHQDAPVLLQLRARRTLRTAAMSTLRFHRGLLLGRAVRPLPSIRPPASHLVSRLPRMGRSPHSRRTVPGMSLVAEEEPEDQLLPCLCRESPRQCRYGLSALLAPGHGDEEAARTARSPPSKPARATVVHCRRRSHLDGVAMASRTSPTTTPQGSPPAEFVRPAQADMAVRSRVR